MSYVYIQSEPGLWTVGLYDPSGKWQPESDHDKKEDAANRVSVLNGIPQPVPTGERMFTADEIDKVFTMAEKDGWVYCDNKEWVRYGWQPQTTLGIFTKYLKTDNQ